MAPETSTNGMERTYHKGDLFVRAYLLINKVFPNIDTNIYINAQNYELTKDTMFMKNTLIRTVGRYGSSSVGITYCTVDPIIPKTQTSERGSSNDYLCLLDENSDGIFEKASLLKMLSGRETGPQSINRLAYTPIIGSPVKPVYIDLTVEKILPDAISLRASFYFLGKQIKSFRFRTTERDDFFTDYEHGCVVFSTASEGRNPNLLGVRISNLSIIPGDQTARATISIIDRPIDAYSSDFSNADFIPRNLKKCGGKEK